MESAAPDPTDPIAFADPVAPASAANLMASNPVFVDSLESYLRQPEMAGASILIPPREVPGVGRVALIADSAGAQRMLVEALAS